jgi:hypothetical protein
MAARLYRPTREQDLPVVLYIHGGGWTFGSKSIAGGPAPPPIPSPRTSRPPCHFHLSCPSIHSPSSNCSASRPGSQIYRARGSRAGPRSSNAHLAPERRHTYIIFVLLCHTID